MNTFDQSVTRVQVLVGQHSLATAAVVGALVNSRHSEFVDAHEWSRKKSEVLIPGYADKVAGTVTLTNASAAIAGSGTAWATTDTGKYILIDSMSYVFTYVSATSGTLSDYQGNAFLYPGATTAGLSYVMFKRFYSLGVGIDSILGVGREFQIRERDQEWLDAVDPLRRSVSDNPLYFARGPRDSSDLVQIELYPRLSHALVVSVKVKKGHSTLSGTMIPIVPSTVIEWSAAVDACFFLHAKTKEPKWMTLATTYQQKAADAFDLEKTNDSHQFGQSPATKDSMSGMSIADTDFRLDHDIGVL